LQVRGRVFICAFHLDTSTHLGYHYNGAWREK
jgi:hypothetical protein